MKISLFYEFALPRPWAPDDEHLMLQDCLDEVEAADKAGFSTVWLTEHHFLEEYCHSTAPEMFLAGEPAHQEHSAGIRHHAPAPGGESPCPRSRTHRHPRPDIERARRIRHR